MKFKRSCSKVRNLESAYKFAFGGDINHAFVARCVTVSRRAYNNASRNDGNEKPDFSNYKILAVQLV